MDHGLRQWSDMEAFPVVNAVWNNEIQTLWKQQQEIGWAHLFKGHFVQQWTTLQQEHLQNKNLYSNKCTGQMWAINMILFLWDMFLSMWEYCNECIHGAGVAQAKERQAKLLTMQIKAVQ
eukprot:6526914-Ditylum_brightwellii.AAC.2